MPLLQNLKNHIAGAGDTQTALLVVVADPHTNSKVGLNPPEMRRGLNARHVLGKLGRANWRAWLEFWDIVGEKKTQFDATVYTIALGDLGDENAHSDVGLISTDETEIKDAMCAVADPMAQASDYVFIARGTESHAGENGRLEEWLARDLFNAQPYSEKVASWWVVRAEIAGLKVTATHHPPSTSLYPHTLENAVVRSIHHVVTSYVRAKKEHLIPDLLLWAHSHTRGALVWGMRGVVGAFLPPWQLHTAYGHRKGLGVGPRCVGGLWLVLRDGKILDREFERWYPERRKTWTEP